VGVCFISRLLKSHQSGRALFCAAAILAGLLGLARTAEAAPVATLDVDWERLAEAIRDARHFFSAREARSADRTLQAQTQDGEPRSYGLSPHLSLVARDWGEAEALYGHLTVSDQVRLSRSSRMLVSRLRLLDGRFVPFIDVGLGQWRVDRDLMPVLPRDVELAAQLGFGFELRLWDRFSVALELDHTILYREQHEPQMVTAPHLWGSFIGGRAVF
jgi:hypothetical protein